jgi:Cytochrome c oxidase subunit III.
MFLIEEYVKIFRIDVWLYPPIVLINTDEIITNMKNTVFTITDSVYDSTFFVATEFQDLNVIIGKIICIY